MYSVTIYVAYTPSQACLTCLPTAVYSGEVCRVGVEVYNCGQVPLNSLRLTSSLGEHILIEKVWNISVTERETYVTVLGKTYLNSCMYLNLILITQF